MDLSTKSLTFARNLAKPAVSFCKQTFKPNLHLAVQLVIKFYANKDLKFEYISPSLFHLSSDMIGIGEF